MEFIELNIFNSKAKNKKTVKFTFSELLQVKSNHGSITDLSVKGEVLHIALQKVQNYEKELILTMRRHEIGHNTSRPDYKICIVHRISEGWN